ncbi:adenylate cyclase [Xaviernesmea oryzae]|uniref:Adenylate cyclase n=1 Tax=Xaviernesmea oryzae TaxID=464029 RepID=A0A1Q9B2I1_9HYPH|nr:adenylate/guanylate cyclase domain-containing protein [Xaviernesmea oryzae]OLP62219.1 adenylate cyclase [Xaviernesmea oryzae]SEL92224.1 adenylate cyclase [Xaviernesmea oryzae]
MAGEPIRAGARRGIRRLRMLAVLVIAVIGSVAACATSVPWSLIDLRVFDYLSTLDPPPLPADGPIVVAIDEPSMAELGLQWPWPRALHARLVEALRKAGARAIGFDIIFAEPAADPQNDAALARVLGPDVVLAGDESVIVTPQAEQYLRTEPLPALLATGASAGIASVALNADGALRRLPEPADGFAAVLAGRAGHAVMPPEGERLIQTFGPARTYPTVSYYQALDPKAFLPPKIFQDRPVIVGLSLQNAPTLQAGGADSFATAFTAWTGRLTAGAEVQATIYDNLVHGLSIRPAGPGLKFASILAAALAGGLLVLRSTGKMTGLAALCMPLILAGLSFLSLRFSGVYMPPAAPSTAFLLVVLIQAAFDYSAEQRMRRDITRAFSSYLSPDVVRQVADDPSQLKLGGQRRTLSILFCDVRGFTTISEALKDNPEELTRLINRLLTPLSEIVLESGGTIDKYIGDCVMAFWNAPLDVEDHARRAVGAALAMLAAMDGLNAELEAEAKAAGRPYFPLRIGVGINTGDCVVGNMGSSRRFDYSVLGDSVNLASRLEGESKNYGVPLLLGPETARQVADAFTLVELDSIAVKGRHARSPVFTALSTCSADALARHAELLQRRYAGTLGPDDPELTLLGELIPELKTYYRLTRERLAYTA